MNDDALLDAADAVVEAIHQLDDAAKYALEASGFRGGYPATRTEVVATCTACNGSGICRYPLYTLPSGEIREVACGACGGKGTYTDTWDDPGQVAEAGDPLLGKLCDDLSVLAILARDLLAEPTLKAVLDAAQARAIEDDRELIAPGDHIYYELRPRRGNP